jgi:hypothetical protein
MIVKQTEWVWVIRKAMRSDLEFGKIEEKKNYTDLRRWNGDKISSHKSFLRVLIK